MDSARNCQHPRKVWGTANEVLLKDPPIEIVPWICSDCGAEGQDHRTRPVPQTEYARLLSKKARGGFRGE